MISRAARVDQGEEEEKEEDLDQEDGEGEVDVDDRDQDDDENDPNHLTKQNVFLLSPLTQYHR